MGAVRPGTKQTDMDQLYRGITEPTLTTEVKADPRVIRSQSEDAAGWREPIRGVRDAKHSFVRLISSITLTRLNRRGGVKIEVRQRRDTGRILPPLRGLIRGQSWAGFNNPLPPAFAGASGVAASLSLFTLIPCQAGRDL